MTDAVTSTTTTTTPTTTSQPSASEASVISSDFETFLKMLTVQMQNQDPLNPIESTDYAVQLATFSSVEQQVLTNDLLEGLGAQLSSNTLSEYASWVGMQAGITGAAYFDTTPVEILPAPADGADTMRVNVRDEAGNIVQTVSLDATSDVLAWGGTDDDGNPFPAGFYTFELESYQDGTLMSTNDMQVYSPILEARSGSNGPVFILSGGTEVTAGDINSLRDGL